MTLIVRTSRLRFSLRACALCETFTLEHGCEARAKAARAAASTDGDGLPLRPMPPCAMRVGQQRLRRRHRPRARSRTQLATTHRHYRCCPGALEAACAMDPGLVHVRREQLRACLVVAHIVANHHKVGKHPGREAAEVALAPVVSNQGSSGRIGRGRLKPGGAALGLNTRPSVGPKWRLHRLAFDMALEPGGKGASNRVEPQRRRKRQTLGR